MLQVPFTTWGSGKCQPCVVIMSITKTNTTSLTHLFPCFHTSYHHVLLTMETVRIVLPKLVFSTTSQVINTGVKQICHWSDLKKWITRESVLTCPSGLPYTPEESTTNNIYLCSSSPCRSFCGARHASDRGCWCNQGRGEEGLHHR